MSHTLAALRVLSYATTGLSITAAIFSIGRHWTWMGGVAVLACLLYEVRIRLLISVIKNG